MGPDVSEHSYGFRPGRSAHQAVAQAQRYVAEGYNVVVDLDLEKFFDRVNHDSLMARVAARVSDKRVLKLTRAFLNAGVMEDGLVRPVDEGMPQGGPLSPMPQAISCLTTSTRNWPDAVTAFAGTPTTATSMFASRRAGERVMASASRFLTNRLRLKVNEAKSAVARPEERKFLGFSISNDGSERRIAPKALDKFKGRIRDMTRRTRGFSLQQLIQELKPYIVGWRGYFGLCQTPESSRTSKRGSVEDCVCIFGGNGEPGKTASRSLRRRGVASSRQRSQLVHQPGSGACPDIRRSSKPYATPISSRSVFPESMRPPKPKGPSGDNQIASGVIGYGGQFTTRAELATGFG